MPATVSPCRALKHDGGLSPLSSVRTAPGSSLPLMMHGPPVGCPHRSALAAPLKHDDGLSPLSSVRTHQSRHRLRDHTAACGCPTGQPLPSLEARRWGILRSVQSGRHQGRHRLLGQDGRVWMPAPVSPGRALEARRWGILRSVQSGRHQGRHRLLGQDGRVWDARTGQPLAEPLKHDVGLSPLSSVRTAPGSSPPLMIARPACGCPHRSSPWLRPEARRSGILRPFQYGRHRSSPPLMMARPPLDVAISTRREVTSWPTWRRPRRLRLTETGVLQAVTDRSAAVDVLRQKTRNAPQNEPAPRRWSAGSWTTPTTAPSRRSRGSRCRTTFGCGCGRHNGSSQGGS